MLLAGQIAHTIWLLLQLCFFVVPLRKPIKPLRSLASQVWYASENDCTGRRRRICGILETYVLLNVKNRSSRSLLLVTSITRQRTQERKMEIRYARVMTPKYYAPQRVVMAPLGTKGIYGQTSGTRLSPWWEIGLLMLKCDSCLWLNDRVMARLPAAPLWFSISRRSVECERSTLNSLNVLIEPCFSRMINDSGICREVYGSAFRHVIRVGLTQQANRATLSTEKIKYFKLEVK